MPFLDRRCLEIHRAYPLVRADWSISQLVSSSLVEWFQASAASLERLSVTIVSRNQGMLPQLLALAGVLAPRYINQLCGQSPSEGFKILSSLPWEDLR